MSNHFLLLFLPLILSNIIHMIVVKNDWLQGLKLPLSTKLFGANKTYRGFVVVPVLNSLFYGILKQNDFLSGALIGLAYMVFELPNSYIKRKFGIAPGQNSSGPATYIMDKCDSSLGVTLVYSYLNGLSVMNFLILFLTAFFTHVSFSYLLVKIRIKERF